MAKPVHPNGTVQILRVQFVGDGERFEEIALGTSISPAELAEAITDELPLTLDCFDDNADRWLPGIINTVHIALATLEPIAE